jgi:hypothetical protein
MSKSKPAARPAARQPGPVAKAGPTEPRPDARHLGKLIRVRATKTGFVDNVRRREGDVFDVHAKEFSEKWMETVDGSTPTQITGPAQALKNIHDQAVPGKLKTTGDNPLGAA